MKDISLRLCLVVVALFGVSSGSYGASYEQIKGSMDCKVKTNYIIDMVDGIPKKYSGFVDGFKVGDTLRVEYQFNEPSAMDFGIFENVENTYPDYVTRVKFTAIKDLKWVNSGNSGESYYADKFGNLTFSKNMIRLASRYYQGPDSRLVMKRYYKDDWHGTGTVEVEDTMTAQIYTIDCRPRENNIDTIVNFLNKIVIE